MNPSTTLFGVGLKLEKSFSYPIITNSGNLVKSNILRPSVLLVLNSNVSSLLNSINQPS